MSYETIQTTPSFSAPHPHFWFLLFFNCFYFFFAVLIYMKHQTQDVPVVHLELGSKLQIAAIKEGDDVYMECSIRAHPWVTKVTWKHNVSIVDTNHLAIPIIYLSAQKKIQTVYRQRTKPQNGINGTDAKLKGHGPPSTSSRRHQNAKRINSRVDARVLTKS